MNLSETPESIVEIPDAVEASPEAPAAVVSICKRHINLLLSLGIAMSCFAVLACAVGVEMTDLQHLNVEYEGFHPESIVPLAGTGSFILAALAAVNATAILRYWSALRVFRRDRRITVLHRTMCRMRTAWLAFGILICTGAFLVVKALVFRQMPAPAAIKSAE